MQTALQTKGNPLVRINPAGLQGKTLRGSYLANFHLRNKDFAKSASYLLETMSLMETDSRYYALFYLRYELLFALNQYFTGFPGDAIMRLQKIALYYETYL